MFGKIKGKLKDVFKSNEDLIEENHDSIEEVEVSVEDNHILDEVEEKSEEKSGFLGRLFGSKKKEDKELEEVSEVEDEMLEDVSDSEKKAIKEHKDLSEEEISENKIEIDEQVEKEDKLEKQIFEDEVKSNDFERVSEKLDEDLDEKNIDDIVKVDKVPEEIVIPEVSSEKKVENKKGFFGKTFSKLKAKEINEDDFNKIWINLQLFLLEINIAYGIVEKIEVRLKKELIGNSFNRFKISDKIKEVLEDEVEGVLKVHEASFLDKLNSFDLDGPVKILVLGVNGTGKTTTIAKIVKFLQDNNKSVCVAAADTFRAAAVEQLEEHSKALNFKLIMHKGGSDPAAVAFDAIEHAKAKKLDVVLIDTAGRMPNNSNLMVELEKVKRVSKADMAIFVGDSVSGNDLIDQINLFDKGVKVDGTILTKVDTDEKPGSVVTIAYSIDKPIYFLGVGQTYEDLVVFDSKWIAKKLFDLDED